MLDVFLDAIKDSAIVFGVVLLFNVLISFLEGKLATKVAKDNRFSPLIGAGVGLIPQCGFSIVATDLYVKEHITMGTLVAVYIACSDEALPIIIANPSKMIMVLPLLGIKLVVGFAFGYLIDFIYKKKKVIKTNEEIVIHEGCCHHSIEEEKEEKKHHFLHSHLVHPLIHSLKTFLYVFIVNIALGYIIYFVGEDVISSFLNGQRWLSPILSIIVGLIPNCASSVIITQLFIKGSLTFGATIAGLCCNAGLGLVYLFKENKKMKDNFTILGWLIIISLITGYLTLLVETLI